VEVQEGLQKMHSPRLSSPKLVLCLIAGWAQHQLHEMGKLPQPNS